jgi:hypothetical protein
MMNRLLRIAVCGVILNSSAPAGLYIRQANAQASATQAYNSEQLDALLAPIALYPDALLAQTLMASTFPLQVVSAGRWVEDPANKSLSGDALATALVPQTWDPSVKSLVPFPSVLALLNSNLDWTQQLGYAFAEEQAAVMNSVQRLRYQAQTAGNLKTTEQQIVRVEKQVIVIEPAKPTVVYVPSYNPTVVYGAWPYPAYPPVYLPPPPGYVYGTALVGGIAFATGIAVVGSLWGWAQPGWGRGYVNVNVNYYNNINVNRTQINSAVWQPNRPGGRPAGLSRPPNGPVGQPARASTLPANAIGRPSVNVPGSAVNKPTTPRAGQPNPAARPVGTNGGQANTSSPPGQGTASRPGGTASAGAGAGSAGQPLSQKPGQRTAGAPGQRPVASTPGQRPTPTRPPAAFNGIDSGRQAAQNSARGNQSRGASQFQPQNRPNTNIGAAPTGRTIARRGQ